jgi:lysozyme
MRISSRGLSLIKEFEGLELEAYQDIVGIWTIGYGHTSMAGPPDVVPGMEITESEASEILRRDLKQYEQGVEKAVKVSISQNMFDALVSITYNIGVNGMKSSTFIKRINNKDFEGAAEAMKWWNKAGGQVVAGLKRRREAEAALFLEGWTEDKDAVADNPRGAQVEENSPRRGSLASSRTVGGSVAAAGAGAATIGSTMVGDEEDGTETAETPVETPTGTAPTVPADNEDEEPTEETAELESTTGDLPGTVAEVAKETQDVFATAWSREETQDAVVMAAGVIAVIAALYVVVARVDDWRNHKR